MRFTVQHQAKDSRARTGILETAHGIVQTPVFMPVATQGAVKTLSPEEVKNLGGEIILGNTYHLHLRPGEKLISDFGGLSKWMNWPGPTLTDSGGYQAYSLGATRANTAKTTNEGVRFYSHLDGQKLFFTPESVIDIQLKLGSDIVMPLDDCPPIEATEKRVRSAVIRTTDWAKRSINHYNLTLKDCPSEMERVGLFGIVQGGLFEELRQRSLNEIQALPFDGIAIGGVAIASEGKDLMEKAVDSVAATLDPARPHYLMGVGEPVDLIRMIDKGIDMFDCVLPTRLARHGAFWTTDFRRENIRRANFTNQSESLDPSCGCSTCRDYSSSYLRHLIMTGETFGLRLLSIHNLWIIFDLINQIRASIAEGNFATRFGKYLN